MPPSQAQRAKIAKPAARAAARPAKPATKAAAKPVQGLTQGQLTYQSALDRIAARASRFDLASAWAF